MRKKIIAGNWKMNKTIPEAIALVKELKALAGGETAVDVVVVPPFTALYPVAQELKGTSIGVGAQNLFWKASGAYTSQIAPGFLVDAGAQYVLIGHSETRGRFGVAEPDFDDDVLRLFGESDSTVNRKAKAALAAGLIPIVCIGETLAERKAGTTDAVVSGQTERALAGIPAADAAKIIFAYEPVWAIGTGEVCGADEADRVCGVVRASVAKLFGAGTAEAVRIQYGGSMKPDNAKELLSKPNIDGGLIGGASLKAKDFVAIIAAGR
ncbi:MAG: triose-phosphate isomerase [Capsulimonadaceae bacterium]|nr:triose-phosphate isomerase [Capsulimonadaceae bacterium]